MRKAIAAAGLGFLALLSRVFVVSRQQESPTITPTPSPAAADHPTRSERLFRMTNRARHVRAFSPLKWNDYAASLAKQHSRHMARTKDLHHRGGYGWSTWGENVGAGGSVRGLFKAFMNSPPHRANILNSRFTHTGIGFAQRNGVLWVTVIFFRPG